MFIEKKNCYRNGQPNELVVSSMAFSGGGGNSILVHFTACNTARERYATQDKVGGLDILNACGCWFKDET